MTTATRPPPHHNNLTCYVDYRCRRPDCVARMRAYERERRRNKAAGISPFIDADPVRQHLHALHAAGISDSRIAFLTGLPERTISGFTERQWGPRGQRLGLRQKTTPRVANLILAVQPDPANAAKVSSIGSRRRIQALIAAGWPQLHIAKKGGLAYSTLTDVMRKPTIMASTAAAVANAYDEIRGRRPVRNGVSARESKMARSRAASYQWAPPSYWDDPEHPIDDPEFQSRYGITAGQVIAEEARWLMQVGGLTQEQAADRLGRSHSYVKQSLHDYPEQVAA